MGYEGMYIHTFRARRPRNCLVGGGSGADYFVRNGKGIPILQQWVGVLQCSPLPLDVEGGDHTGETGPDREGGGKLGCSCERDAPVPAGVPVVVIKPCCFDGNQVKATTAGTFIGDFVTSGVTCSPRSYRALHRERVLVDVLKHATRVPACAFFLMVPAGLL